MAHHTGLSIVLRITFYCVILRRLVECFQRGTNKSVGFLSHIAINMPFFFSLGFDV